MRVDRPWGEVFVRGIHVLRDVLLDRGALLRILDDALEVAGEHVDDELLVAAALQVVVELHRFRGAQRLDLGPQLAGGGEGAPLHVRRGDEEYRLRGEAGGGEELSGQLDVLPRVAGVRFHQDRAVRHAVVVPFGPVARVSRVAAPQPMFTVAPGRSLPVLLSLACRRTLAALKGSVMVSRVVALGVTMTSWSATTSWSGLPEAVSLSR